MLIVIAVFLVLHLIVNQFLVFINRKSVYYFFSFLLITIFLYYATHITYTADYHMYDNFYKWEYDKTDILFQKAVIYFKDNYLQYHDLFVAHIFAITILYVLAISRLNKNIFYVFAFYLLLLFIPYINQIRYFMAFPSFLLATYYFIYRRNYILFVFFVILSGISHSAVLPLYSYFLFYYFIPEKYYKKILKFGTLILLLASYIISSSEVYTYFEHFGEYIKNENQSTFFGGLFNILPSLTIIIPLYFLDENYKGDRNNKTYIYLRKLSYFTCILLPAAVFIQILNQRYVYPFVVVWILFFLFLIKDKSFNARSRYVFLSYLILIVALYIQYGLADIVFGDSFYIDEFTKTINSIKIN